MHSPRWDTRAMWFSFSIFLFDSFSPQTWSRWKLRRSVLLPSECPASTETLGSGTGGSHPKPIASGSGGSFFGTYPHPNGSAPPNQSLSSPAHPWVPSLWSNGKSTWNKKLRTGLLASRLEFGAIGRYEGRGDPGLTTNGARFAIQDQVAAVDLTSPQQNIALRRSRHGSPMAVRNRPRTRRSDAGRW